MYVCIMNTEKKPRRKETNHHATKIPNRIKTKPELKVSKAFKVGR